MRRQLIPIIVFALSPFALYAQGHRGPNEPPLNKNHMELPFISNTDIILVYNGFVVNYNINRLIPNWVAYELTAEEVLGDVPRAKGFSMDLDFKERQAMREDYSGTGWDKGHMAPAADMKWSQSAMNESFYFTNICPQDHILNGKDWHSLEKSVRNWALKYGRIWVVCGPYVYTNYYGTIGKQRVFVPDGFFKAILRYDGKKYYSIAFVFENKSYNQNLKDAAVSVNDIEALIGYNLFYNLDDRFEEKIESQINWEEWDY